MASAREPCNIVSRYFVTWFLFAGVRKSSRAATPAIYIGHNNARSAVGADARNTCNWKTRSGRTIADKNTFARERSPRGYAPARQEER